MTFILQRKSRAIFGYGVPVGATCSTQNDKEYSVQYASIDGTTSTITCVTPSHGGTISVGGAVTQTNHWVGATWQQKDWETDAIYPYGTYGVPKVKVYGCYLNASCVDGYTLKNYYAIPRINIVQTATSPSSCTCDLVWDGDLLMPFETSMSLWEEINGVWTLLSVNACPANTQSSPGGYNPTVSITIPSGDAGIGKRYRAFYNCAGANLTGYADMYVLFGSNNYDLPNINVSEHSFVTFGNAPYQNNCAYDKVNCLPVLDLSDVQFQMNVDVSIGGQYGNFPTPILGDGITSGTQLYLAPCEDCTIPEIIATSADFGNFVAKLDTWNSVPGTEIYVNGYINWIGLWNYVTANYAVGDCFRICLCKREPAEGGIGEWVDTVLGCMDGCFQYVDDECYTSLLQFKSSNNEFCFYYSQDENYLQSIRLPMYLRDVQFPSTSTGYQKSDGTWVKLSERIQEEWTLTTDWMEARIHKALKIALAHDTTFILGNMGIADQMTAQNNYSIQWESKTKPYPLAKGSVKLNKTINTCSVNTNC